MQTTCIMRTSKYKDKIIKLFNTYHVLSMSEIGQKIPEANFSTIFRNVEQMIIDKELKKIVFDKDNIKYELASHTHNHFVCDTCGDVEEVEIELKDKNKIVRDAIVHGFCNECK